MELTNAIIKQVKQLDALKYRREYGLFKVEGTKAVTDTLSAFSLKMLLATAAWMETHSVPDGVMPVLARPRDMERMSGLSTPAEVIAVYNLPDCGVFDPSEADSELILALDTIQDPGNLGTIIRTADWYGITTILCNHGTADAYSLKTVQATMGAIARVRPVYCDLAETLQQVKAPIYGTFLDGDDIYDASLTPNGVIVIGNEGRGISERVAHTVTRRLYIPPYPAGRPTSESLNAGVATAVTVSEFRRRIK